MSLLRLIGNIIWFILGGFVSVIAHFVMGLILCLTIVGIPFGIQCFKMVRLVSAPFGKRVELNFFDHPIMNTLWIILFGWSLALPKLIFGIILCITIVGIPFGLQVFKGMRLAITPFGARVQKLVTLKLYR